MALYNNLRDYRFNDTDVDDIRGASVYGVDDEKLGKIDDVIYDDATGELRYVVIDSGGWLNSKKFVVPALRVMIRNESDKDFHVNLSKDQVNKLPEYKEQDVESEKEWKDYEKRYEAAYDETGDVMHKKGSTHAITPETVAGAGAGNAGVHVQSPRRIAHDMPRFGATSSSDTTDNVSLAGETDVEPVVSGTLADRKSVGSMAEERLEPSSSQEQDGELREDPIGTGRLAHNPRMRTFEDWMRKYREDIVAKRKRDNAA